MLPEVATEPGQLVAESIVAAAAAVFSAMAFAQAPRVPYPSPEGNSYAETDGFSQMA